MHFVRKILFFLFLPSISTAQSNLVVPSLNKIQCADQSPGTEACMPIQNAVAALPANGGEIDVRGFLGFFRPFGLTPTVPGDEAASEGTCYRSSRTQVVASLVSDGPQCTTFRVGTRRLLAGSRYRQNSLGSVLPKRSSEERKQIQG